MSGKFDIYIKIFFRDVGNFFRHLCELVLRHQMRVSNYFVNSFNSAWHLLQYSSVLYNIFMKYQNNYVYFSGFVSIPVMLFDCRVKKVDVEGENMVFYQLLQNAFWLIFRRISLCFRNLWNNYVRKGRTNIHAFSCFLKTKINQIRGSQRDVKRCSLSWLTNSALVYEPKCGLGGAGGGPGVANQYSWWSPNKLWRSNSL